MARTVTTALSLSGTPGLPLTPETQKWLKVLVHSSAQNETSVAGVVWTDPDPGSIVGTKIGEFTGQQFEAELDGNGNAVLFVRVGDFGGYSLTTSDTPVVLVRNSTKTTGIIDATVTEE